MCIIQRMKYVCIGLILFSSSFLFSQNSPILLRSVSHKIPPYTDHWSYTDKALPLSILSTTRDSSTVIMFYNFIREKDDQLKITEVRDVNNTVVYSYNYYYNSLKQVERMDKLSDVDYDGKADDLDYSFSFHYDSLGRVIRMQIKKEYTIARDLNFTWNNGNITQVHNTDGELNYIMNLSFDELPNVLEPIKWEYLTTTGTLEFYVTVFCKNNLVKATLFPAAMDSSELEIRPRYNAQGYYISNGMEGVEYHY